MHNVLTIKRRQTILILCLALALMFVQGLQLHAHTYDHDHGHYDESMVGGHAHLNKVHSAHSVSNVDHHDEVVSEVDFIPEGLLKNLSFGSLAIALLTAVVIVVFVPPICARTGWRRNRNSQPVPWRHSLRPPLRAPPR